MNLFENQFLVKASIPRWGVELFMQWEVMTFVWASVVDIELIGHTSLSSREIPLFTWKKKEDQISTILKLHLFNYGWAYKWDVTCLPVAHQAYLYVTMLVYFHWLGSSFLSWSLCVHRVIDRHEVHRSLSIGSCIYFLTYGLFQSPPVRFKAFPCLHFVIRRQKPQMDCVWFCVSSGRS